MTVIAGSAVVEIKGDASNLEATFKGAEKATERFTSKTSKDAADAAKKITDSTKPATTAVERFTAKVTEAANNSSYLVGPVGDVADRIGHVSSAASAGVIGLAAFAAGVAAVAAGLKTAIEEAEKLERIGLRTNAVLKATGFAAGLTAKEIRDLSNEIEGSTLAGGDDIEVAAQKLLVFKSVAGDTFKEALRLSQDLAAVGFGSVDSAALQLGKALEDPVVGLTALRRAGIAFSAVQQDTIKNLVETNRLAEAQAIILAEVRSKVGGAGAAEAGGLAGAFHQLKENTEDFFAAIGNSGPLQAATTAVGGLAGAVGNLNKLLNDTSDESIKTFESIGNTLKFIPGFAAVIGGLAEGQANRLKKLRDETAALSVEEAKRKAAAVEASRIAQESAKAERDLAAELERRKKLEEEAANAAKQLAEQRRTALANLQTEVRIQQQLAKAYLERGITADQLADKEQTLTTLAQLKYSVSSKEGQAIAALIEKRNELKRSIDEETKRREEAVKAQEKELENIQKAQESFDKMVISADKRTESLRLEAEAFGMAEGAAASFKLEQELLNEATREFGSLTEDQKARIHATAEAYGAATTKVGELKDAQEKANKEAKDLQDSQKKFSEDLASGLADALTGTENLGQAMDKVALSIAKAVIQAELMKAINGAFDIGGGSSGKGALAGASSGGGTNWGSMLGSVVAGFFHEGGTVGQTSSRKVVPMSTFIGAPRLHDGLKPDEFPAILQTGEEVVPRGGKSSSGSSPTIIINNSFPPGTNKATINQASLATAQGAQRVLRRDG